MAIEIVEFAPDPDRRRPNGHAEPFFSGDATPRAGDDWRAQLMCAASITPVRIRWLWKDWIARGKMHVIAGLPGTGKTTLAMKMAATVSAGGAWPDGARAEAGNVIIWSGEDDPADVLVPRLAASGADLDRVFFAGSVTSGKETRAFDPARDVDALKVAIKAAGGASLIIIDPIVSATTADSHKNSETRRGLQPLVDMAAELDAALLGVTHFTKGSAGREPIDRVTGSVAFGALARIVMITARQEAGEDGAPGPRTLMRAKSNIGPDDGGFNYELQRVPLYEQPDIIASVVSWGARVEGTAREILAEAEAERGEGDGGALDEAKAFLIEILSAGPLTSKEVKREAADFGASWRTVRRAQEELRIKPTKSGEGGAWVWELPAQRQQDGQGGQDGQGFEMNTLPENGHFGPISGEDDQDGHPETLDKLDALDKLDKLTPTSKPPGDLWEIEI